MPHRDLKQGQIVKALHKGGAYIGELTELRQKKRKGVVKILAVAKHPTQGDLHHPGKIDVPLFHERPALAFHEHASIPLSNIQPYEGEVPEYKHSLRQAVEEQRQQLQQEDTAYNKKALATLDQICQQYDL